VGRFVGAPVGAGVGACVAMHEVCSFSVSFKASWGGCPTNPSRQGQVCVPSFISAQYVLSVSQGVSPVLRKSQGSKVGIFVGEDVGVAVVGELVGAGVGDAVGAAVGESVGAGDGTAVGTALGAGVGAAVGDAVGVAVGASVGDAVGVCVSPLFVGEAVGAVYVKVLYGPAMSVRQLPGPFTQSPLLDISVYGPATMSPPGVFSITEASYQPSTTLNMWKVCSSPDSNDTSIGLAE
jgi:hypothetical protein